MGQKGKTEGLFFKKLLNPRRMLDFVVKKGYDNTMLALNI